MNRMLRRGLLATAAGTAAVAMAAGSASAHHCFIPMYNLNGPSSPNWMVLPAEDLALFFGEYETPCPDAAEAGYAALEGAGLPVGVKAFMKMTIGDPKETGRMNPNGADGKGLEYLEAGSPLPGQMVMTYIEGAESYACDG
ncbi:hypothetical protein ACQE98_09830 [Ornithinimicrobium sp. W1679]|uniref:hypothetical protein n=1 Tax=Ornithinimicrobium sp. W1679 TaxID=3418770 RepID=UPI003CEDBD08